MNAEAFKQMADDYAAAHEAHESLLHGFYTEEEEDAAKDAIVAARNALFSTMDEVVGALKELRALVVGECPSLLDEDSGGDSRLALVIEAAIEKATGSAT